MKWPVTVQTWNKRTEYLKYSDLKNLKNKVLNVSRAIKYKKKYTYAVVN